MALGGAFGWCVAQLVPSAVAGFERQGEQDPQGQGHPHPHGRVIRLASGRRPWSSLGLSSSPIRNMNSTSPNYPGLVNPLGEFTEQLDHHDD